MTVQEVIDSQIPSVTHRPYVVYQFPSRALLNPEKEASVLQDQEIWIEPAHVHTQPGESDPPSLSLSLLPSLPPLYLSFFLIPSPSVPPFSLRSSPLPLFLCVQ